MNEIRFTIPGKPFGKQRPRVVNRGKFSTAYTPKETVEYENLVKLYYSQTAHGYMFPDDAMLDVRIFAFYEVPKSASKKKKAAMLAQDIRPTKKPDFDNIGKIICDSLNLVAYHDDSAVVDAQSDSRMLWQYVQPQRMRAERRKDVRKRRKMQELRSQNPVCKDEVGKVHACE